MQSSTSSIRASIARHRPRHQLIWLASVVLLLIEVHVQLVPLAAGTCQAPAGATSKFIDADTPPNACIKPVCVGSYEQCCGEDPFNCDPSQRSIKNEELQLVFSDEFTDATYSRGTLGTPDDIRWHSLDLHYSSDKNEWQNYKPENVQVKDGQLLLTMEDKPSSAFRHLEHGSDKVNANKTSGMVQSWNKFCFTGGLVEFSVKLPGDSKHSGFWAATWLMGNLGRAGYYPSLQGMWPFSYNACADGSKAHDWNNNVTQRISKCNSPEGRGAPEIDVLEYGALGKEGDPQYVHTMQMAPILPPNTTWMKPTADPKTGAIPPGIKLAGARNESFETFIGKSFGPLTVSGNTSEDTFLRTGSRLTDTYTASSRLKGETYWETHHNFSVLWEPGQFVRWYLDDVVLFEVSKEALRAQTQDRGGNLTVADRLIPLEPLYIVMNLAMSNGAWARVADDLEYPGVMSIDHVRIWQRPSAISVGCDAANFTTSQYISCNRHLYLADNERGMWKFPYCRDINAGENRFLLGLAGTVVIVLLVAALLLVLMSRAFKKEQEMLQQQSGHDLPAGITRDRTPENKIKSCYINKGGNDLQMLLSQTRPDLLAVTKAKIAQEKAAAQEKK